MAKNSAVLSVLWILLKNLLLYTAPQSSIARLTTARQAPMIGASQNIVAAGLFMPIFSLFSNRWVKLHRRPLRALALVISIKPSN